MKFKLSIENNQQLALFALFLFCLLRPICSLDFPAITNISVLRINQIFNMASSYLFLIVILLGIRNIKLKSNEITIILLMAYASISVLWGSEPREIVRFIFPSFIFFLIQVCQPDKTHILKMLKILVLSFSFTMIVNAILITCNYGAWATNYWSGIKRYQGLYGGPHSLAHESLVFLLIIGIFYVLKISSNLEMNKAFKYIALSLVAITIFNIFKSYTRTVYLGLATIAMFYMLGKKHYVLIFILLAMFPVIVFKSDLFHQVFFDVIDPLEGSKGIETMGSGRLGLWREALNIYLENPERYFIGRGLGKEVIVGSFFGASHNDLISLLCSLGLTGLALYLLMMFLFVFDILTSPIERTLKFLSIGYIFSVILMNFLSNSYLNRFQLGQYFFFVIGILSAHCKLQKSKLYR
ncbi:MAG: O-antigen ligase family protein [Desulfosarcina sp.]|nr:O-antigen ligase family protein [Desulfosarcina sp.]